MPAGVVQHVLQYLDGDARSLCAATCVSRSWAAAASEPALWRVINVLGDPLDTPRRIPARWRGHSQSSRRDNVTPQTALDALLSRNCVSGAPRPRALTDGRLFSLVARAGGALEILTLSSCNWVSDEVLASCALSSQPRLRAVSLVGCGLLSLPEVASALRGTRVASLRVHGTATLRHRGYEDGDQEAFEELRALVGERNLDCEAVCDATCGGMRRQSVESIDLNDHGFCSRARLPRAADTGAFTCDLCNDNYCGLCHAKPVCCGGKPGGGCCDKKVCSECVVASEMDNRCNICQLVLCRDCMHGAEADWHRCGKCLKDFCGACARSEHGFTRERNECRRCERDYKLDLRHEKMRRFGACW